MTETMVVLNDSEDELARIARIITDDCGGDFNECFDWLCDGDVTPGDSIASYEEEWQDIGCEYLV